QLRVQPVVERHEQRQQDRNEQQPEPVAGVCLRWLWWLWRRLRHRPLPPLMPPLMPGLVVTRTGIPASLPVRPTRTVHTHVRLPSASREAGASHRSRERRPPYRAAADGPADISRPSHITQPTDNWYRRLYAL